MESKGDFIYKPNFNLVTQIPEALTFDDILMIPQYSEISSRSQCSVKSKFSKNIPLNIPIVSSPMDTVTEWQLAKAMAQNGGLGIIHRFMTIDEQANQVRKVKKAQAHIIFDPYIINENMTYKQLKGIIEESSFQTFLVSVGDEPDQIIEKKKKSSDSNSDISSPRTKKYSQEIHHQRLAGILTRRDIKNFRFDDEKVSKYMTPRPKLLVYEVDLNLPEEKYPTPQNFKDLMLEKRVEKIPLISTDNRIIGLVTRKDIERTEHKVLANTDPEGKLYVGGAIGANKDFIERAQKLIDANVDVLVVDIANGHSTICIDSVKTLKENFPDIDIVAGSIATGEGAERLIKAGADGIRCGIGNGSICITRIVAGSGVPQFSALLDVAPVCKFYNIPLISDGGNKNSGNMCKALGVGASCVMLGRLVAGCQESPSQVIYREGKIQKVYRGMAGFGANVSKAERTGETNPDAGKFTPEGVEGYIPYAGPLEGVLNQFVQGIKSGMSYSGATTIEDLQQKVKFLKMTQAGFKESNVHSINKF